MLKMSERIERCKKISQCPTCDEHIGIGYALLVCTMARVDVFHRNCFTVDAMAIGSSLSESIQSNSECCIQYYEIVHSDY